MIENSVSRPTPTRLHLHPGYSRWQADRRPVKWGLSSRRLRRLLACCVLPVLDFGAEAWRGGQKGRSANPESPEHNLQTNSRSTPDISSHPGGIGTIAATSSSTLTNMQKFFALRTMALPGRRPVRLRTSSTFPPEYIYTTQEPTLNTTNMTGISRTGHSQVWRIHYTVADLTPSPTQLETIDCLANPPWLRLPDPGRVSIHIPHQRKGGAAGSHTSLINTLTNNPQHLLIKLHRWIPDGNGSNGTGMVARHANQPPAPGCHRLENCGEIGKAHGWRHPRAPSGKWLWKEKSTEEVLTFLKSTRVGCISTRQVPPEELAKDEEEDAEVAEGREGEEGEEGGPGPPAGQCGIFCLEFYWGR